LNNWDFEFPIGQSHNESHLISINNLDKPTAMNRNWEHEIMTAEDPDTKLLWIMTPFHKSYRHTPNHLTISFHAIERTGQLKNKCSSDSMLPHPPTHKIDDFVSCVYAKKAWMCSCTTVAPKFYSCASVAPQSYIIMQLPQQIYWGLMIPLTIFVMPCGLILSINMVTIFELYLPKEMKSHVLS
jgi:hypothetical protein